MDPNHKYAKPPQPEFPLETLDITSQDQLGPYIRNLRLHRKISQETLAEKAGVHYTVLQRLEKGSQQATSLQTLLKVLSALDASITINP